MSTKHLKHRVKTSRTVGWTHCVSEQRETACSGAAHGGITVVDTCSCGAVRKTESNGRFSTRGAWHGGTNLYDE